jgi:transglutaminase-like putative cysteine protease
VQKLQPKDWLGEIGTIFEFVRKNIRYIQDVNDVETLQWPTATLLLQHGDCDDMVMLTCAMLESIGYVTKSVAIGFSRGNFDHVYLEVYVPDRQMWLALDPTEPNPLGWAATGYCCRVELPN